MTGLRACLTKSLCHSGQDPILWTTEKDPRQQADVGTLPAPACLIFVEDGGGYKSE